MVLLIIAQGDGLPFSSFALKWLQVSQLRGDELIRLLVVEEGEDVTSSLRQSSTSVQPFCDLRERQIEDVLPNLVPQNA